MTEHEWLACDKPKVMLVACLGGVASDRKLRLFACACARKGWPFLVEEASRRGIEVSERFADGQASLVDLNMAHAAAWAALKAEDVAPGEWTSWARAAAHTTDASAFDAAKFAAHEAAWATAEDAEEAVAVVPPPPQETVDALMREAESQEERAQSNLLRDILGNPYQPTVADPRWRTPAVLTQALAIYEEQAYARLPLLADLLEQAGCDDAGLLAHCRGPGPHVRGCHVVDAILGLQ